MLLDAGDKTKSNALKVLKAVRSGTAINGLNVLDGVLGTPPRSDMLQPIHQQVPKDARPTRSREQRVPSPYGGESSAANKKEGSKKDGKKQPHHGAKGTPSPPPPSFTSAPPDAWGKRAPVQPAVSAPPRKVRRFVARLLVLHPTPLQQIQPVAHPYKPTAPPASSFERAAIRPEDPRRQPADFRPQPFAPTPTAPHEPWSHSLAPPTRILQKASSAPAPAVQPLMAQPAAVRAGTTSLLQQQQPYQAYQQQPQQFQVRFFCSEGCVIDAPFARTFALPLPSRPPRKRAPSACSSPWICSRSPHLTAQVTPCFP